MIILLHSLRIPSPAHFLCGLGKHAYYPWLKINCFIPLVWQPPLLTGGYLELQTLDLWSRRPDIPMDQNKVIVPHCFEMPIAWKVPKNWWRCPFSQIYSYNYSGSMILYKFPKLLNNPWLLFFFLQGMFIFGFAFLIRAAFYCCMTKSHMEHWSSLAGD